MLRTSATTCGVGPLPPAHTCSASSATSGAAVPRNRSSRAGPEGGGISAAQSLSDGQDLAESRFRCPRLTVQGPRAAGPEDPASSGPSSPWRSLSPPLPRARSVSSFAFLLPPSLPAASRALACCLCTARAAKVSSRGASAGT